MKYLSTERPGKKTDQLYKITECIPGRVYEFVREIDVGGSIDEYPILGRMRLCAMIGSRKHMINLDSGVSTMATSDQALYIDSIHYRARPEFGLDKEA